MKYEKGFKFMYYFTDYEVIEFMEQHKMYRLNNPKENRQNELKTEEDIDNCILMKDEFIARRESNRIFREKQKALEEAEQEKELKEKQESDFCYGYTDTMKDMQKGKVMKVLNKRIVRNNHWVSRKRAIEEIIRENKTIELKKVNLTNRYSSKKVELTYKELKDKTEHRIYFDDCFIEITKTEFDYAEYLIDNKLISVKPEAV